MRNYRKPEMYSDADWEMVQGYGRQGWPARQTVHGSLHARLSQWGFGRDWRSSRTPRFFVAVREMIPGITTGRRSAMAN